MFFCRHNCNIRSHSWNCALKCIFPRCYLLFTKPLHCVSKGILAWTKKHVFVFILLPSSVIHLTVTLCLKGRFCLNKKPWVHHIVLVFYYLVREKTSDADLFNLGAINTGKGIFFCLKVILVKNIWATKTWHLACHNVIYLLSILHLPLFTQLAC